MTSQPIIGAPIMAPAIESSSIGTGVPMQIEGDVVEDQGEANAATAVEKVMDAAAEVAN